MDSGQSANYIDKIALNNTIKLKKTSTTVSLFPNPNTGTFYVEIPENNANGKLEIYDVLGKQVFQSTINSSKTEFNLGAELKGIYFYYLTVNNEFVNTGKLVFE